MTTVKCPTCGGSVTWEEKQRWRPFCSERCRLIDLGQWASESHRIPGESVMLETDDESGHSSLHS